ncbi:MAG TPA: hypothetical protein VFO94_02840 [Gammaproteobacteria bacterium]|nr:hypothetical protein [Gammaproteobacteria bacterium]
MTMGMPAAIYRWYYRAHGRKSLMRNVLNFVGIAPVRSTLIGRVESLSDRSRAAWLSHAELLGRRAR